MWEKMTPEEREAWLAAKAKEKSGKKLGKGKFAKFGELTA